MKILYSSQEIAILLGVGYSIVCKHIKLRGVNHCVFKNRRRMYDEVQLIEISDSINKREVTKYYPMKTTETFYIYESKMNML